MFRRKTKKRLFQFNQKQRKLYASRFTELGNLVAVALVFSQFLAKEFNQKAVSGGVLTWISLYLISYKLLTKKGE